MDSQSGGQVVIKEPNSPWKNGRVQTLDEQARYKGICALRELLLHLVLEHPNVGSLLLLAALRVVTFLGAYVPVVDIPSFDRHFLVLECLDGDLQNDRVELLRGATAFSHATLKQIASHCLKALSYLHSHGVWHRVGEMWKV